MENYKAAIADLQTFIDNSTADASIWNNLGVYQESNGELEAAMKSYNKALELDSNYYYAYINRGNTFVEMKKYQEALADFNKALESGEIPVAYAGRGDVYYGLGKYDKAVENYNKAVELYPFSAHTYCYLSLSYFELEKYQDSIDAAQSSIQINKKCGEKKLYEIQARSYYGLKDYDQGILYINKALAMGNYAFGHYYRGIIYQAAGRDQEAIQDLEFFINSVTHSEENQIEIADAEKRLAKLKK
jgi:tetratricopeptide (TPR) repeat protein